LAGASITAVRYCTDGHGANVSEHSDAGSDLERSSNVVNVETGDWAPVAAPRLGKVTSSCGWCGSDQIDELCRRLRPVNQVEPLDLPTLAKVVRTIAPVQPLFESTGAVHAAAVFDRDGEVVLVREDVGRHNAVDKVIGALLLEGDRLPASEFGLFVSGRASIEMVQKAWAGGFGTLLAVSAPTALAVETARRARMTLVGFARPNGFNVYSHGAVEDRSVL
jgi:FdhD protein